MLLFKIQLPRRVRLSRRTKEFQLISFFQHQLLYLRLRATQGAHNPSLRLLSRMRVTYAASIGR